MCPVWDGSFDDSHIVFGIPPLTQVGPLPGHICSGFLIGIEELPLMFLPCQLEHLLSRRAARGLEAACHSLLLLTSRARHAIR
ncbi:hypothetical protein MPLSOD_50089 [Mesorhizobium sp. SOD10]|nr:hypothetical protein MPLSOD_50089 [Mesorhizobium sp. SOD10]